MEDKKYSYQPNPQYPNTGSLFPSTVKKTPKHPDFFGGIGFDRAFLQDLLSKTDGDFVTIKLSGWKQKAITTGNSFMSISVDTFTKTADAPAPKKEEADPWA